MEPAVIAAMVGVFGAIVGTLGAKIIDFFMNKRNRAQDLATQMRSEQREEIVTLRSELDNTEDQLDDWKIKFFELKEENVSQQAMLENLQDQINEWKNSHP
jgi:peptidoglycan hydrolase CwlO-like protein